MIKVSIIGAGAIGGNIAFLLGQKGDYNIQMIDLDAEFAKGKALDINQALVAGSAQKLCVINGSNKPQDIKGSDVVIVTAGVKRTKDMSRDDLLNINAGIIKNVALYVKQHAPHSFVIIITNPLDSMTWLFQKTSNMPAEKIVGMAGNLDEARFRYFLAKHMDINPSDIRTTIIGPHNDSMMPLIRHTTIAGISLRQYIQEGHISEEKVADIIHKTRTAGAHIVELMKTSAFYTPAVTAIELVESCVFDQRRILTASVCLEKSALQKDTYAGMPCLIGCGGIEGIYVPELDDFELKMLTRCLDKMQETNNGFLSSGTSCSSSIKKE